MNKGFLTRGKGQGRKQGATRALYTCYDDSVKFCPYRNSSNHETVHLFGRSFVVDRAVLRRIEITFNVRSPISMRLIAILFNQIPKRLGKEAEDMSILAVSFVIVEGITLYIYAQRKARREHHVGYWRGYELGFRTGQSTPIAIKGTNAQVEEGK